MFKNISKLVIATVSLAALPGVAQAGTSTTSSSVTFQVTSQCAVTGATVNLGSFRTNQTWGDVGDELGIINAVGADPIVGTRGKKYANWGSVTCDKDVPYFVKMSGADDSQRITFTHNGKTVGLLPLVEELGGTTAFGKPGEGMAGTSKSLYLGFTGIGTGAKQDMLGSAAVRFNVSYTTAVPADLIGGQAATLSDQLTYTLTF